MPRIEDFIKGFVGRGPGLGWVIKVQGTGQEYVHRSFVHDRGVSSTTDEIRIDFSWEFDTTPELNIGTVWLYNLENERIAEFPKGGPIRLKLSWQNTPVSSSPGLEVFGTVEAIEDFVESEMRAFKIIFTDAPECLQTKVAALSWKPNVKYSRVFLDDFADLQGSSGGSGLPALRLKAFKPARDGIYRSGMNNFRNTWQHMRMVARDMRSKLYVYNREVVLLPPGAPFGPTVTWSQVTGLQKVQRAILNTQDASAKVKYASYEPVAYRMQNLFTPEIGPDSIVRVISVDPSVKLMGEGTHRVVRGRHYCHGDQYMTEVDCVPISQSTGASADISEAVANAFSQARKILDQQLLGVGS